MDEKLINNLYFQRASMKEISITYELSPRQYGMSIAGKRRKKKKK